MSPFYPFSNQAIRDYFRDWREHDERTTGKQLSTDERYAAGKPRQ